MTGRNFSYAIVFPNRNLKQDGLSVTAEMDLNWNWIRLKEVITKHILKNVRTWAIR